MVVTPSSLGEPARVDGTRAAVGDDREVTGIPPLLRRHRSQRARHAGVRDAVDAVGGLEHRQPERRRDALDGGLGQLAPDRDLAVRDLTDGDEAEHDVRIGHRRLDAPAPVARRPRVGARAARADLQAAGRVEPGDAASTRADLRDVDRRDPQELARAADEPAARPRSSRRPRTRARARSPRARSAMPWPSCRPCRTRSRSRSRAAAPSRAQRRRRRQAPTRARTPAAASRRPTS